MNWLLEDMAVLSLSPVNIGVCYHRAELESGRVIHRESRHVNCDQLLPAGTIVVTVLHLAAGTASSAMVWRRVHRPFLSKHESGHQVQAQRNNDITLLVT
jgi:hypothetical protein